ncbi:3,4-dehydroadipyl-CoA semialdehyde dehydrogenase [Undibacterium terreum]|uniref:Bifunctional aldehyde dehydrogenase/enoyl-CoA hydratase n=1 Tax=Undibacterium terreum TaxID=1224302 RepID=A0A916XR15_9BURK|nr:3,4-dehydroadipyl-CoA semialdehyde dehydrogenase [Undibacterium terreum]GGC97821.1 bifunctional aldehyde dehydrogenase/enoyl-CoA hydratase [Undibacterium terreum]
MTNYLQNYLGGAWQARAEPVNKLLDPITGAHIASTGGKAENLQAGFDFARTQGSAALQAMSYGERAAMLDQVLKVLQANRDAYYDISLANSGTTKADSGVDIEGALFTLGYYAKLGAGLGDARLLLDGSPAIYSKDKLFQSQHILTPVRGVALFINAFNFPSWGLWEKAAPALLSGVPVIIKPATVTAWLTQRMVADVIAAGILPPGALSIVCGSSAGLLDQLRPFDVLSFTGSADTAVAIRSHDAVARHSVRVNVEADSLNCSILGPDALPGTPSFDAYVSELVREMSTKSGQRCTAIRRALVPAGIFSAVAEAASAKLAQIKVGNPRNEEVRMGSLVSREQYDNVQAGIRKLAGEAQTIHGGSSQPLVDADPAIAACVSPTLFGIRDADQATLVHDHEVFGPVSTLLGYRDTEHALALAQRGLGSLVASAFSEDSAWLARTAQALAASHGRVHTVTPEVAKTQTGHGNVMPGSIHGGPGRAGGGEELGGLRGLAFYHRRSAIQGSAQTLENLSATAKAWIV